MTSAEVVRRKLADERIMLVGGAGFIGHNLALDLRKVGASVMVVDNLMVNNLIGNAFGEIGSGVRHRLYANFLNDRFLMMRDAGVVLRNADARLMTDMNIVFEEYEPTKVVHLSAIASAVDAEKNPGLCFDLQLVTLRNVLELSRAANERINQVMLLSSSTVYGDFETPTVDENTRPRPQGIYANAKYMAERLVRTYNQHHGLGTTIIRPSALYGERCVSRRVSQAFIENALMGKPLLLEGGGDGRLDFTYIRDLTEGMILSLALHDGPGTSQTFNLTFGSARTIAELAAVVRSVVPNVILEERPREKTKPIRGTLSTERAEKVLGFKAQHSLEVGYKGYCDWYADQWQRFQYEGN
ncbi:MAG: NAD-dependent epimerase/dehydratase family protein [Pseudorhodoplanes sp.]|nr:NAD-dependent epimerase/dehydratase family protein [Pseudorhodoplanes sp.]